MTGRNIKPLCILGLSLAALLVTVPVWAAPQPASEEGASVEGGATPSPADSGNDDGGIGEQVEKGKQLVRENRLDEARGLLEELVAQAPENAPAHYWLGTVHMRQQRFDAGLAELERSVALAPENLRLQLELAKSYEVAERQAAAEKTYREILEAGDGQVEARLRLGRLYEASGRVDEAIAMLERVESQGVQTRFAREAGGRLNRLYQRKSETVTEALREGQADADEAVELGKALVRRQQLDAAQEVLELVIEQAPENAQAHYWLAQVFITRREFGEGLAGIERSVALAPDNMRLKIELAKAYERAGRLTDAEEVYDKVVEAAAEERVTAQASRRQRLVRARRFSESDQLEEAVAEYDGLLADYPGDARILELKAHTLDAQGRDRQADRLFRQLLAAAPDDAGLRMRIAALYERRGDQARARELYGEVVRLTRTGEMATRALRRMGLDRAAELLRQERFEEALELLGRVLELVPESPVANLSLALAYHQQKSYEEAEAAYRKVLAVQPGNLDARLRLAQLLRDTERFDEAARMLEEVVKRGGRRPQARRAQRMLNRLAVREARETMQALARGEGDVEEGVALGKRLVRGNQVDAALRVLNAVVAQAPDDPQGHYWLGQAYSKRRQYDRAVSAMERSAELAPGNMVLLNELARIYEQAGRLAEAERVFGQVVESADEKKLAESAARRRSLLRARRLAQEQDHEAALAEYDTLLADNPDSVRLLSLKGELLLDMGREVEAEALFGRIIERAPEDPRVRLNIAQAYERHERPERAAAVYREVLEIAPGHINARLSLGELYQKLEQYEDAIEVLSEARQRSRGTPRQRAAVGRFNELRKGVINRGRRLLDSGQMEEARSLFEKLLEHAPDDAQGHYWLSQVYRKREAYRDEVAALEKAVELRPGNIRLQQRLAYAYVDAGLLGKAERALKSVLEEVPYDSEAKFRLADIYKTRGERDRARAELIELIELDPPREWRDKALDTLGRADGRQHMQAGEWERALGTLRRVLDVAPDDTQTSKDLAEVYRQLERYEEAEATYERLLQRAPDDMGLHVGLARLYEETDREAEAVEEYHRVAEAQPDSALGREARRELQELLLAKAERELERIESLDDPARIESELAPVGAKMVQMGGTQAGRRIFEYLLKEVPDSPEAHYWLGQAYAGNQRYTDGLVLIKQSIELAPDEPLYRYGLGRVYRDAGLYQLAEETLEKAGELDPDNVDIYFDLAELYERRGADGPAREQYARVLALDAGVEVRQDALDALGLGRAEHLLDEGQLSEALEILEQVDTLVPREPAVSLNLGIIYHRQKRYGAAETAYRRVLEVDEGDAEARMRLGRLYAETDRVDAAIELLEEVAGRAAGEAAARDANELLGELFARKAQRMAAALESGGGDVEEAVGLGKQLVLKRRADDAVRVLEPLVRRAPDNPRAHYWLGQAYVGRGELGQGLERIEHSVALMPENMRLKNELAKVYERTGRLEDAAGLYREVVRGADDEELVDMASRRLGLSRARRFVRARNYKAALATYEELLGQYPQDVALLGERGRMLVALGREDEADRVFNRVLEIAPKDLDVRMRLAGVYRARGELDKFLAQLARVIEIDSRSGEADRARELLNYDKGVEHMENDALEDAREVFERILTVAPNDPLVHLQLGKISFDQRRYADAEKSFSRAVELDPRLQEAHFMLGRLFQGLTREERAIDAYEKVVELGSDSSWGGQAMSRLSQLYAQRAQRYRTSGEIENAIAGYENIIDNDPDNTAARFNAGLLYLSAQQHEKALEQFNAVLRLAPNNAAAHRNRARIYMNTERFRQAAGAYARAISLEEDTERAGEMARDLVYAVAQTFLAEDRPLSAMRHLRQLNEQGMGSARTHYALGRIYRSHGEMDKAIEAFREAINLAPDNLVLRFNLAVLYERTNDEQLALFQFREIVNRGQPGNPYVEQSRRRMDAVADRLRLFTSQMRYNMTIGESVIEEQDLANTGAVNSSFSSRLFYNLATRFRPTDNLNLTLNTGFTYNGNHSTQNDSLSPRIGFSGRLNYPDEFYNASVNFSESRGLLLDTLSGRSYGLNLGGGLRVKSPLDWLRNLLRDEQKDEEDGEGEIERSPEPEPPPAPEPENTELRDALEQAYDRLFPERKRRIIPEEEETIKRYVVKGGDTLWDIAEVLLFDPFLWPEIWQENPHIENPHLIFPGDRITLFYIGEKPVILIERAGQTIEPPEFFEELTPEERERRTDQIARSVEEGMELYERALELMRQGALDEALELFELILEIVPDDPLTNLNAGIIYHRQERYFLAESAYMKVLEADPGNLEARLRLGRLYSDMDRLDDAIAALERVRRDGPGTEEADAAGEELLALYERKAEELLDLPRLGEQDVGALIDLGGRLLELEAFAAAQRVFEGLVGRRPDHALAHYHLAQVLMRRHDLPGALAQAEESVALAPDEAQFRLQLARAYRSAERLQAAEAAYDDFMGLGEDPALLEAARRERALVQAARRLAAGQVADALDTYLGLLEDFPQDPEILALVADAYRRLGQPEKAVEFYERAVAAAPEDIDLRLQLADAYERLQKEEQRRAQLAKAVEMAPDAAARRAVLDRLGLQRGLDLLRRGELDQALAVLEGVLEVVPDDPLTLLNVGVIHHEQGDLVEAEATFQRVLDTDPRNLTALLHLGMLYADRGQTAKAIATLEKVVRQGRGTLAADRAAEKLQQLEERRLRSLMSGELEESEPRAKTISGSLFYNDSNPVRRSIAETFGYGASLSFSYPSVTWGNWNLDYRFTIRDNEHPLGSDYAYNAHQFSLSVGRPVPNLFRLFGPGENIPRLFSSISLSRELRNYTNVDTNALNDLGRQERREKTIDSLSLSLNYRLHDRMTASLSFNKGRARSSLPVGFVFNPATGRPIAFQSTGLGSFSTSSINLGLSFRF